MMLDLKGSMAKIDESISNLKEQYREHDHKLDSVSQEVYAAKRVVIVAAWVIGILIAATALLYPIIHSAK
jgi:NADPH-dependent 2,4-dienoyl-CoA reductase/sulfur reductase-like enzyme